MLGASTGRLRQPAGALTKGSSVDQQPQDSNDQNDRDPLTFEPGLSLVYTDEAHGHGNAGTDSPPAQSPLDAAPEPGSDTPELKDASFTDIATRARFTDSGAGHTDNYSNPEETSTDSRYDVTNPWRFLYGCLTFDVLSMTGKGIGPGVADGDLTGSVGFDMGAGRGEHQAERFGHRHTADRADRTAGDLNAAGASDTETPGDLDYSWDVGDDSQTKDGSDVTERTTYEQPGTYAATVTVTDPRRGSPTPPR